GSSSGGETGTGGTGEELACCLAVAVCGPDEVEIAGEADCPEGATCYENAVCCTTVWCAQQDAQCDAAPACGGGAFEVDVCPEGAECTPQTLCGTTILCQEPTAQCDAFPVCPEGTEQVVQCPEDARCSSHSICGSTIQCRELENPPSCGGGPSCPTGTTEVSECPDSGECESVSFCGTTLFCVAETAGGACDPNDPNREYVAESMEACAGIDFSCDTGLAGFDDDCGCGCEQDASCPEYVDCMPGSDVDPRCSDPD